MDERTCSVEGCGKKHRAKGLCSTHYNQLDQRRHIKYEVPCTMCGALLLKVKSGTRRPVCSSSCLVAMVSVDRNLSRRWFELVGPVRFAKPIVAPVAIIKSTTCGFIGVICGWCGTSFVHDRRVTGSEVRFCTSRCAKKASRARYELARGRFAVSAKRRRAIYERDGWVCQLCHEPVDRALHYLDDMAASLDHIECQSWALIPDHSDANLRLAHRLCNSLRGDQSMAAA